MREERIGDCRLILGDCLEVLPDLKVAHVITDPPFSEQTHSLHDSTTVRLRGRRALGYSALTPDDVGVFGALIAEASMGWVCWFTDANLAPEVRDSMKAAGRTVFAPLPFFHPGRSCRLSGDGPSSWTDWIVVSRTKALHKWGTLPGGYVAGPGWNDKGRMGGKPLQLMKAVVMDYSRFGDLVCDPFMGAGTTLVACAKLGRKGIGIEIDPVCFDIACRRVEEAYRQPDMFVEPPKPAEQLDMLK